MGQRSEVGIYEYIPYSTGNPYIEYAKHYYWVLYINPTIWVDYHPLLYASNGRWSTPAYIMDMMGA